MTEAECHASLYDTRRENQSITLKLKETQTIKNGCLHSLNHQQESKQRGMRQNDDLNSNLSQKVSVISDLQQRVSQSCQQINYLEDQRNQIDNRVRTDFNETEEKRVLVERLKCERNELMTKMQRIQMTHEHSVHDFSLEQR